MTQEISEGIPVHCDEQYPDVDEQCDKLVEELETIPLGIHDTTSILIMNPFNSSLKLEKLFIVESGAEIIYLLSQATIDLMLCKSISFTTNYGNG